MDPHVIETIVADARVLEMNSLASVVFLVYDALISLDDEIKYVWRSSNVLPKYLYFISRYLGIIGQTVFTPGIVSFPCAPKFVGFILYSAILGIAVEIGLMLRIDALYGKSNRVRLLMGSAFFLEVVVVAIIYSISVPYQLDHITPFPSYLHIEGCYIAEPVVFKLSWLPILVFETLMFSLNAAKCISHYPLDKTPLIYRLFRDASLYYILIFLFMLPGMISQFAESTVVAIVLPIWVSVVCSYSGTHLLLGIRKIAARKQRLTRLTYTADFDLPTIAVNASDETQTTISSSAPYARSPTAYPPVPTRPLPPVPSPRPPPILRGSPSNSQLCTTIRDSIERTASRVVSVLAGSSLAGPSGTPRDVGDWDFPERPVSPAQRRRGVSLSAA